MTNRVDRALESVIPEKSVFVRSAAKTRLIVLTPLTQLGLAAVVAGGLGWMGYASTAAMETALAAHDAELKIAALTEAHEAELSALRAERDGLRAEIDAGAAETAALEAELGSRQARLIDMTRALRESRAELAAMRQRLTAMTRERREAADRVSELEQAVMAGMATPGLGTGLGAVLAGGGGGAMSFGIETPVAFDDVSGAIDSVIAERDEALKLAGVLDAALSEVRSELAAREDREEEILSKLEEAAKASLSGMSRIFDRAELDLDRILAETRAQYSGSGGPFEPLSGLPVEEAAADAGMARIAALAADLERVHLMRIAVERLPFGRPVRGARETSGFGKRRDPFNGRWARHEGVDYAGPVGTPIEASGDGVVSYAGWMSGYGRVVRIRHAFGFETRYAHLSRIFVKKGDRVARGDRIGSMGNSGRSTGSHLHYEVRIGDNAVDPKRFIEAAQDVL